MVSQSKTPTPPPPQPQPLFLPPNGTPAAAPASKPYTAALASAIAALAAGQPRAVFSLSALLLRIAFQALFVRVFPISLPGTPSLSKPFPVHLSGPRPAPQMTDISSGLAGCKQIRHARRRRPKALTRSQRRAPHASFALKNHRGEPADLPRLASLFSPTRSQSSNPQSISPHSGLLPGSRIRTPHFSSSPDPSASTYATYATFAYYITLTYDTIVYDTPANDTPYAKVDFLKPNQKSQNPNPQSLQSKTSNLKSEIPSPSSLTPHSALCPPHSALRAPHFPSPPP